uniref:Immune mapped protein 2 N-terminal domain-containing protein n=1 Tax=Theileria annulata TaxID=5874 RepID=A0A3B0MPM0_THEAN
MGESVTSEHSKKFEGLGGTVMNKESELDPARDTFTGAKVKSKEDLQDPKYNMYTHTVVVKKTPTREFENFQLMDSDTPVCHLVYESVDNGSFYLQWKENSKEQVEKSVMMMVPTKAVQKFKLTSEGGRSLLSYKVAPDKNKYYSYICQFLKLAKDYNSKIQLMPGWNTVLPYKCDLYLHYEDNKVAKVECDHPELDNVKCVAVVGTSTKLSTKMTREQLIAAVRNKGYALTF